MLCDHLSLKEIAIKRQDALRLLKCGIERGDLPKSCATRSDPVESSQNIQSKSLQKVFLKLLTNFKRLGDEL